MNELNAFDTLQKEGAFYCKDIISKEISHFITAALLRRSMISNHNDDQVPGALTILDHELFLETLHETIWPKLEFLLGEEILPTYTYSRLYTNGNVLEKHTDRPACEISVTVQLGRSHHYTWPIFAGGKRFDLAEGDGVVYLGCDVEHWRKKCKGPPDYYSGQAFFHFVRKNGPYAEHANDKLNRKTPENFYIKNRAYLMETK
jgi:hypothetical protein